MKTLPLRCLALLAIPTLLAGCGHRAADTGSEAKSAANEPPPSYAMASAVEFQDAEHNREEYDSIVENEFQNPKTAPLSTFSIDVDTASYSNVRRLLTEGSTPAAGAVRIEEFVNYFSYHYEPPTDRHPIAVHADVATCPWQPQHRLARIALQGKEVSTEDRGPINLVFLLDVSGSMGAPNKLPLVKRSLTELVQNLEPEDRIAIVVYASASGLVLPSTPVSQSDRILDALDRLSAGGSTNGGEGIRLAYDIAREHFDPEGVNRVVLCTDGDFNVGTSSRSELVTLLEQRAKSGVYLSIVGFGTGNYRDGTMEELSNRGNGNYAYIDTMNEARKVFGQQLTGTLITIAKDVKVQVDFNPQRVQAYRLIGYENRMLAAEDFKDDTKDAGEIGAGHTVTAFYEIVPHGVEFDTRSVDASKYQTTDDDKEKTEPEADAKPIEDDGELLTVRVRYKQPDGDASTEFRTPLVDQDRSIDEADDDFRFATAVAEFGLLLRDSKFKGEASFDQVRDLAAGALAGDAHGHRSEFLTLIRPAKRLLE